MKPCPFCGTKIDSNDPDTLYPSGTGWEDDEGGYRSYHSVYDVPKTQRCYKIVCQEHYGGCGTEVHGDSVREVIEKWNTRV